MKNQTIALTFAVIIAAIFVLALSTQIGYDQDDIQAYEDCIQEQTGMSSVEYYQKTGQEPKCSEN